LPTWGWQFLLGLGIFTIGLGIVAIFSRYRVLLLNLMFQIQALGFLMIGAVLFININVTSEYLYGVALSIIPILILAKDK
jgi:hypothetical protein